MEPSLGKRIKALREALRINQEELAQKLEMDRASVSLVENDKRSLKAHELVLLSNAMNISIDELLNIHSPTEIILAQAQKPKEQKIDLRISVPRKNLKKFKEILLYILGEVGAKPNVGETVLYKLLYFIDFNYYEKYEKQIIGATYIKNHHGPTPIEFQAIINEMIESKEIEVVKSKYFQHLQKKYLPLQEPDLSVFNANEIKLIDDVLQKLSGMNASTIREYSHQDVPWMVTPERQKIDYESVFSRTRAYSAREYSNDEIQTSYIEKIHYIYTDNKFFRKLIKKNNEKYWDAFYDSLIQTLPSLDNGLYRQIFTSFSFLEAIGEGRIRTKYAHKLNLNKFLLKHLGSLNEKLSESNEEEYYLLGKRLDDASLAAAKHFRNHPELSKEKLLKKINDQLELSKSEAAEELIQNTLVRYKDSIINNYEACLDRFSAELAWDSICSFDFLQLAKKSNGNNEIFRKRFTKLKELLLHVFHDAQVKGRDLNSFRLCEAIQRERLTSKEFIQKIESENGDRKFKISIPGMLKEDLDLCDVDVIHYATLGYFDSEFEQTYPVIVFTCDDRNVIKTRILLQLSILRFMCNNVIGSKLQIIPGEIHFIDSQTGRINAEPLIIADIKESETFGINLDPLSSDSESYVEFIKASPLK